MVVVKIGVPVGDPWVMGELGHVNKKKMAEKKLAEKNKLFGTTFFFNDKSTNQSTTNQIFSQSDKMDFADVSDT